MTERTAQAEAPAAALPLTDDQIAHLVSRFLNWRLPATFRPDCGITFKRMINEGTDHPHTYEPVGTNLFDAIEAKAMVCHMIEGMPAAGPTLQPPSPSFPPLRIGEHARMAENLHQDIRKALRPLTIGDAALVLLALERELADHIEELRQ